MTNLQKKSYSLQEAKDPSNQVLRISHKGAGRPGVNTALKLSKNFILAEFLATATGLENVPGLKEIANLKLLAEKILQPLRDAAGVPVIICSGFRSHTVNELVDGMSGSSHTTGRAVNFCMPGMSNQAIIDLIIELRLPFDQLNNKRLNEISWVHVSHKL